MRKKHGPLRLIATWFAAGAARTRGVGRTGIRGGRSQPGVGQDGHGQRRQRRLRRRQRQRRQRRHLLGEHQQRLPAVGPGRPRRRHQRQPGRAEAAAAAAGRTRTQTLSVQGSTNGTAFTDLSASAGYTFNPATGNTVTINFTADQRPLRADQRHRQHRLAGRPALRVRGLRRRRHRATPPRRPRRGTWRYTQPAGSQITLTWGASTDNGGSVAGYDVYGNGALRGERRRHRPDLHRHPAGHGDRVVLRAGPRRAPATCPATATPSPGPAPQPAGLHQRGPGQGDDGDRLDVHRSSPANANDGNVTTYWEGSAATRRT